MSFLVFLTGLMPSAILAKDQDAAWTWLLCEWKLTIYNANTGVRKQYDVSSYVLVDTRHSRIKMVADEVYSDFRAQDIEWQPAQIDQSQVTFVISGDKVSIDRQTLTFKGTSYSKLPNVDQYVGECKKVPPGRPRENQF